jgi:CheY-like chemotaxis protein
MAMFGSKKSRPSEGSELVLAYLEDAQRVRAPLVLLDPKGRETPANLVSVTEERVSLGLQGKVMADKGDSVTLLFYLDGLRLKAPGKVGELKPGTLVLELPSRIELAERRKKPRARINPREGATAVALTGLFEGIGLTGSIENLSESGFCLRVDRAMNVKTQARMNLGANLLSPGDPFMLIKLNKLPKCPPIEVGGTVTHLAAEGSGLLVGFQFESGKEGILAPVKALVSSRAGAVPTTVPQKARRPQEPTPSSPEAGVELAASRPAPRKEPEPPPAPEPKPATPAPGPESREEPQPPPADPVESNGRSSALLRVKKRTRCLLLAMAEGPEREALAAFLSQDGYGRVLAVTTLTELLEQVDGAQLVFVDGGVAELQGLALASLLRHRMEEAMPPLILAEASVDAELVMGAQETRIAQILVKPYDLDGDFLRMIEGHLGIG